jgi:riboflavin synthase
MFTGIVQGMATIESVEDHDAIRTFTLRFRPGFCDGLRVGASVAVDGVCLTATDILSPTLASFDAILQSLKVTTLGDCGCGQAVNVERAAKDGAEIGGHPISGHIDFAATIRSVTSFEGNKMVQIGVPPDHIRYIFPKGYIAINGASLTVSEVDREDHWFEVWLIPETRRVTVFDQKAAGDWVNVEIERNTQVVVDTIRDTVRETFGRLQPVLEALLQEKGLHLEDLTQPGGLKIGPTSACDPSNRDG